MLFLGFSLLLALVDPSASPSTSPSPSASASPTAASTPAKSHSLKLDIPPGWVRTESGRYNEWDAPDHSSDLRVTVLPPTAAFRGDGAADAVKSQFATMAKRLAPNANPTVTKVTVCNGTQTAYRVDAIFPNSPAFMMIIVGSDSDGLINYEVPPGGKVAPEILKTIDKICWP